MILLAALAAGPAHAQIRLQGIDGMTATVFEEGRSSFAGLGLRAQVKSGGLLPNVTFLPTAEWWRNSNKVDLYGIHSVHKDATLALDARWEFTREGWFPYVGAGYGLHFIGTELDAPSLGIVNESDAVTKGGLAALGGVVFAPTGSIQTFVEGKYHWVSPYRQFKLNWGLSYLF
jgi:hypothetical protein